jgi:CopG family transcriptional regulator/antitoxin EndoAI
MPEVAKITISLAPELLQATDEVARQERRPRSHIIREALALYLKERERQEMIKGYQEMAALNKELAEESMSAVNNRECLEPLRGLIISKKSLPLFGLRQWVQRLILGDAELHNQAVQPGQSYPLGVQAVQ